jgi:hypothetical protein
MAFPVPVSAFQMRSRSTPVKGPVRRRTTCEAHSSRLSNSSSSDDSNVAVVGMTTTIHVGGLEGEKLEDEVKLKKIFSRFGTVVAVTLRHRCEGTKVSWALVSFRTDRYLLLPRVLDGILDLGMQHGLVARPVDEAEAVHSMGAMGEVMRQHMHACMPGHRGLIPDSVQRNEVRMLSPRAAQHARESGVVSRGRMWAHLVAPSRGTYARMQAAASIIQAMQRGKIHRQDMEAQNRAASMIQTLHRTRRTARGGASAKDLLLLTSKVSSDPEAEALDELLVDARLLFAEADADQSGELDRGEIRTIVDLLGIRSITDEYIAGCWEIFDSDCSGGECVASLYLDQVRALAGAVV